MTFYQLTTFSVLLPVSIYRANGSMDMSAMVPDTITNWQATAFALNMDSGLGITEVPSNVM